MLPWKWQLFEFFYCKWNDYYETEGVYEKNITLANIVFDLKLDPHAKASIMCVTCGVWYRKFPTILEFVLSDQVRFTN
jgi:hypothetical protein